MTEKIVKSIREADLVLIGIGEELDSLRSILTEPVYAELKSRTANERMLPFVRKIILDKQEDNLYKNMVPILENKNYFIISTCQDGKIKKAGLNEERIVEPCGGYEKLQCSEGCTNNLYDIPSEFLSRVKDYMNGACSEEGLEEPLCPVCGKPLVFNQVDAGNYIEDGYMDKWMTYKKWLQGTVNKKLCILELGVGMKYPTVIRWPFEKVAFFNQKSEFFRIHSKLYQMPEELGGRGTGIQQSPQKLLKELSNYF